MSETKEMAEVVLQPVGIMGDTRCPRCGTRFQVDNYCEQGHMKPIRKGASCAISAEATARSDTRSFLGRAVENIGGKTYV